MPQKVSLALRISRQGNSATTDNLYVDKQLQSLFTDVTNGYADFMPRKGKIFMKMKFIFQGLSLVHQHDPRFFVMQYHYMAALTSSKNAP